VGGSVAEGEGDGVEVRVAVGLTLGVAEASGGSPRPVAEQLKLTAPSAAGRRSHRTAAVAILGRFIPDDCNPIMTVARLA
jgi:hypothetical protein